MRRKQLPLFALIAAAVLVLNACTSADVAPPSTPATTEPTAALTPPATDEPDPAMAALQAPAEHTSAITQAQSGDTLYSEAPVESAEVAILESFPVQVNLIVTGSLPDGCTTLDEITQRRQENTFFVNLITVRPAAAACTQEVTPFEEIISLDVRGLEAGQYRVVINGVERSTFRLAIDNTGPDTDEPAQGASPIDDTYEQIFVPATGAAVTVPADWNQTEFRWSPTAEGEPYIGLDWVKVDLDWSPTTMLPAEANLISREAVELDWGEGLRFQLEIKDAEDGSTLVEEHLIGPLNRTTVYDLYAGGAGYQSLAEVNAAYETMIETFAVSATPPFQELPESCTPTVARALYVDAEQRYCLLYPAYFPEPVEQNGVVDITGLPLSEGPDPIVAGLSIQLDGPAGERSAAQVVNEVVSQVNDLPITRRQTTLDGEAAIIVEGLPGRFSSRQLFTVYDDTIYHITLMPADEGLPQISEDVDLLWETATSSFTFLSNR